MRDVIIDCAERVLLTALFIAFAAANIRSGEWANWILTALEGVAIAFVLTRRRAVTISDRPIDWALAMGGTFAALLARPVSHHIAPNVAEGFIVAGSLVAVLSKLSLNRRFGLAPANRGVKSSGAYAVVRHPIYLGYFIASVGYLLYNPTTHNVVVYSAYILLQLGRISREERHLMQDADYRRYAARVRFRLVPGLF